MNDYSYLNMNLTTRRVVAVERLSLPINSIWINGDILLSTIPASPHAMPPRQPSPFFDRMEGKMIQDDILSFNRIMRDFTCHYN